MFGVNTIVHLKSSIPWNHYRTIQCYIPEDVTSGFKRFFNDPLMGNGYKNKGHGPSVTLRKFVII